MTREGRVAMRRVVLEEAVRKTPQLAQINTAE